MRPITGVCALCRAILIVSVAVLCLLVVYNRPSIQLDEGAMLSLQASQPRVAHHLTHSVSYSHLTKSPNNSASSDSTGSTTTAAEGTQFPPSTSAVSQTSSHARPRVQEGERATVAGVIAMQKSTVILRAKNTSVPKSMFHQVPTRGIRSSENDQITWSVTDRERSAVQLQSLPSSHTTADTPVPPSSTYQRVGSFSIRTDFSWPQPGALRSVQELMDSEWMNDLQTILSSLPSHQLTLVTSNQPYTEVLLNWLIAAVIRASVDLSQVLVVALDHQLHAMLQQRKLNSILIGPATFLPAVLKEGIFPVVMMARLSIIRLLNHMGYDVINYDTDAILLRDPTVLLQQNSHAGIIGTFGRFPTDLDRKWGITLCTAMLVVKSSPETEEFWKATSRAKHSCYSDQGKMNYGLEALGIQWRLPSKQLTSLTKEVEGVCRNGLQVSLLPYNIACRAGSCKQKVLSRLFIWHKGGERVGEKKRKGAEEGGVWFLRSDWGRSCSDVSGREWLVCIANSKVFI